MKVYQIEIEIEERLAEKFEQYMIERHIPDLMRIGLFKGHLFAKKGPTSYQVQYIAEEKDLELYFKEYAPRLREDFSFHFPTGVRVSRYIFQILSS